MPKDRDLENKAIMAETMRSHPTADLKAIRRLIFNRVTRGSVHDHRNWIDAQTDRLHKIVLAGEQGPELTPEQLALEEEQAHKDASDRLREIAPVILMNLPTPLGKPLGELTGKEGRKLGGWMRAAFKGVADDKQLRTEKSEDELRKLWTSQ